jgi:RHS repeat-associated protein
VYFGGKLVKSKGVVVATDRLGSVRANSAGERMTYYPYGEEKTSTADGREKFGTYTRDNAGTDYADQRYYAPGSGRFMSPDPLGLNAAKLQNPGSWNRYAYAYGDPINLVDPTGRTPCGDLFFKGQVDACYDPCDPATWENGFMPAPDPACYGPGPDEDPPTEEAWKCPANYQAWIDAHGTDAVATGLSEANVLATSAIESGWGRGPFVTGNRFFNLETLWKPGTDKPDPKYAYQVSWMQAGEAIASGRFKGYYALVASYNSAADSFKSFAATLGKYLSGVTDAATFASKLVAHGINAGRASYFGNTVQTFQDCLSAQKQ